MENFAISAEYLTAQARQNRSRQTLPCPFSSIPVPLANKTHRTEAGFLTFSHALRPVPERACPPAYASLFQSGTAALPPFAPLIRVIPFPQKEMRQSMQAPCPFLPEAGTSTAGGIAPAQGQPPFPLPRGLPPAGKPPPPIPFARRGPKTNTAASRSPYGFKNKFRMLPAPGIQRTKQFRQCLRHRHAALHEDRVNPDYTIARRQIRRRQAAERPLPDTVA